MDLYHFHRVLIASTILFCLGFGAYAYRHYTNTGDTGYVAVLLATAAIGVSAVCYLVYFNRKVRRLAKP